MSVRTSKTNWIYREGNGHFQLGRANCELHAFGKELLHKHYILSLMMRRIIIQIFRFQQPEVVKRDIRFARQLRIASKVKVR